MNANNLRHIKGFLQLIAGRSQLSAVPLHHNVSGLNLHLCSATASAYEASAFSTPRAARSGTARSPFVASQSSVANAHMRSVQRAICARCSIGAPISAPSHAAQLRSFESNGSQLRTASQLSDLSPGATRGFSGASTSLSSGRWTSANKTVACALGSPSPLMQRRGFSSSTGDSGHGGDAISGSGLLYPHPRLSPWVKICSACSASATPTEHSSAKGLVKGASMVWEDAEDLLTQRRAHLVWDDDGPRTAFLVKKSGSVRTARMLKKIATWLEGKGIKILVEERVGKEFPEFEVFDPCRNEADFCVTLGGDGTVLHLTSLFAADEPLPPVVAFAMGTLGFLTPYDVDDFQGALGRVLGANNSPVFCTLRTRKCCEVFQDGQRTAVHHVLNECLVDRGSSPAMVTLQVSADRHHITTVQADGLIISTPSGSTAYSMSAGGPMVAPSVAGTLITPIAPHSLSFRPLVVPESSEIVVQIPASARSVARASFDGRHTMRLARGSAIRCTTSKCALPMVSLGYLDRDWMEAIKQKLRWNEPIRDTAREAPADYRLPLPSQIELHDTCAVSHDGDDDDDHVAHAPPRDKASRHLVHDES